MAEIKRYRLRDKAGPHTIHSDKGRTVLRTMKAGETIDTEVPLDEKYLEKFDCLGPVSKLDGVKKGKKAPPPEPVKVREDEHEEDEEEEEDHEGEEDGNESGEESDDHEGEEPKDVTDKFVRAAKKQVKVFLRKDKSYFVADDEDEKMEPIHEFKSKNDLKEWLSKDKKKKKK